MEEKQELTLEEKEEKVRDFRPIDDAFFETLADDIAFCQEILRVILSDKKLIVEDVIVQNSKRNLYGRSVRLDAFCMLGDGTELSELMSCFLEKEVDNPKFPEFSKRMKFLKHEKGGLDAVCEVMERYEEIAAKKAAKEAAEKATKEASRKANINAVKNMIKLFGATEEQILQIYTKEEYEQAVKELGEEQSGNK